MNFNNLFLRCLSISHKNSISQTIMLSIWRFHNKLTLRLPVATDRPQFSPATMMTTLFGFVWIWIWVCMDWICSSTTHALMPWHAFHRGMVYLDTFTWPSFDFRRKLDEGLNSNLQFFLSFSPGPKLWFRNRCCQFGTVRFANCVPCPQTKKRFWEATTSPPRTNPKLKFNLNFVSKTELFFVFLFPLPCRVPAKSLSMTRTDTDSALELNENNATSYRPSRSLLKR